MYWTLGAFDGVILMEAPDEATVTAAMLHLGSLGSVRRSALDFLSQLLRGGPVTLAMPP
jgi:uncharacterized protein with GYD domain